MAFVRTGAFRNGANASTTNVVHSLTINDGDLVVFYINRNGTDAITSNPGGTAFIEAINEIPSGETARQVLYWKIAGPSEPTSYSFNLTTSDNHRFILQVFSSTTDAVVDSAAGSVITGGIKQGIYCELSTIAPVVSDNAVSVVFGGKDRRGGGSGSPYDGNSVSDSYTGLIGSTANQDTAGCYRVFTTGETIAFDIQLNADTNTAQDFCYSVHISFVEGGGAPATAIPVFIKHFRNQGIM